MKVTTSASFSLPLQLEILEKARKEAKYGNRKMAVNTLTIISLCSFLESYLSEIIKEILDRKKINQSDKIVKNMFSYFESNLSLATFKSYEQLYSDIIGIKLSDTTKTATWEAIKMLFSLRNQIVHGREFTIEYSFEKSEIFHTNLSRGFRSIVSYLLKKKLITTKHIDISTILSDKVIYHFITCTKSFSRDLTKYSELNLSINSFIFNHLISSLP